MRLLAGSALLLVGVLGAATTTAAADNKHGHGPKARHYDTDRNRGDVRYFFAPGDVRILREYYGPHAGLPPGLQKKLYRTGRLPPGWERKLRPFPVVVERRLAGFPPYYRGGYVDGYAVVYDPRSRIIIDVAFVGR